MRYDVRRRRPRGWAHPDLADVDLGRVLDALGDPVRLEVVRQLATAGGVVQGAFDVPVTGQTLSHHLRTLTTAGLVRVSQAGRFRCCELRTRDVEKRFPGLLPAILANAGVGAPRTMPP
ncbi:transcriptional regulator [Actinoplanes lobatus]|uniref:DNA-binding transcriptional ArsR family regulator n=1 Tax=Actinoplanes lobatus TaxID=113568 RepID=A0A7W7HMB8_9ACTN|nr:helix-turn-helix transcriptional regulator [Actinoplanes lobatus]MBB4753101.1 DNA-binding transcriptional ArsR family regulator [Actinoplanes lobatus]GGN87039.1 transcriptional regulator [Actinoplanes lobatus]GIE39708.1 transcriptional regulator [Actinoplanes lobatus]